MLRRWPFLCAVVTPDIVDWNALFKVARSNLLCELIAAAPNQRRLLIDPLGQLRANPSTPQYNLRVAPAVSSTRRSGYRSAVPGSK
jgi:hypothetical protein